MKLFTKNKKEDKLQEEINLLHDQLKNMSENDLMYPAKMERLKCLYDLKQINAKDKVSKDTLAVVAGNLIGIALILNYEKAGIVASKAMGFVIKGRV